MSRTFTSGRDSVNSEKMAEHIIKKIQGSEDSREKLLEQVEASIGLMGVVAYGQGIRHGTRQRPKFEDIVRAHTEGFEQGWAMAMEARDNTENWADDQRYWNDEH